MLRILGPVHIKICELTVYLIIILIYKKYDLSFLIILILGFVLIISIRINLEIIEFGIFGLNKNIKYQIELREREQKKLIEENEDELIINVN